MNFFPGQEQPGCPKRWRFEARTEVGSKGEFHEITKSASEVLLKWVASTREIHLRRQCASEGILKGVGPKGEFHEITKSASEVLLAGVAATGEIHLEKQCASEGIVEGVRLQGGYKVVPPRRAMCLRRHSEGGRSER